MLAVEEVRHILVGAGELRDHIGDGIAVERAVRRPRQLRDPLAEPHDRIQKSLVAALDAALRHPAQHRQLLDQRLVGAHLAGGAGGAQLAPEIGIGAGVQPQAGGHFRAFAEDPVVKRAGVASAGARHHGAATERERAGGGGAAEQELAAVEAVGHGRNPLILVCFCRPPRRRYRRTGERAIRSR